MLADLQSYNEVLKITLPNFLKLSIITFLVFIILPKYIFPQKHIENSFDKLVFNIIYMLSAILFIVPLLVFLHIFSIITLLLSFFLLKALMVFIFEKKNYFKILKNSYPPLFIKILNKLDYFSNYLANGNYGDYKRLFYIKKFLNFKFFRYILIISFIGYAIFDINLINFISLSNKTSDVSQFIEWVANLQKNILYADHKTGGADFYGLAIIVFFFQVLTNIDSVLLFSLYPTILLLFMLLGIYYVVYKITDSHYSSIFAIAIFILYCLSPLGEFITGRILTTSNPPIIDVLGLKFYFSTYEAYTIKKDLIQIAYSPYIRLNSGLAYEISASLFLFNLYFLTMSFLKKENKYLILYSLTLFLVFSFHGGGAFLLVIASSLIFFNAILFRKINLHLLKKGSLSILIPSIFGNLWLFSWLKYGIPQDFGNAAPILDKIFRTENSTKQLVKVGKEIVNIVVFYNIQLFLFFLMLLIYPITLVSYKEKRFLVSSMALAIIAIILIYVEENLGFPRLVSQVRCSDYLFIVFSLASGIYFNIFEKIFKIVLKRVYDWSVLIFLSCFIVFSISAIPSYNETNYFYEFTNSEQYNSIALALYKIKKTKEPFTYTVVGFVQSYSKIMDKGFHINVADFIQKYNPYAPVLKIDSKYIYIIVETIPNNYKGLGEWYYRWRKDLELSLLSWVKIYSKFHNNIRVFYNKNYVTIYEIDNREYVKKLAKEKINKKKLKFLKNYK